MKVSAIRGRPARAARRRLSGGFGAFALLYHRVDEPASDPWGLCVTPSRFAAHLEVLHRHATPVALVDLARQATDGTLPLNVVAVTFDDGYADNLHNARPLLERYGVPASVFLSTGYAGHGRTFWWDDLAEVLLGPEPLPETLEIAIGDGSLRRELGEAAGPYAPYSAWKASRSEPSPRQAVFLDIWRRLGTLPGEQRDQALDQLAGWAGAGSRSTAVRALTREEVQALVRDDLVEVGAHTVSHPALPELELARQRDEIATSKTEAEELVGRPVTSFSYPHGRLSPATVEVVREAGFATACYQPAHAHDADLRRRPPDPLRFPRVNVGDWTASEFESRLLRGFED